MQPWIAFALHVSARAFAQTDPARALVALREGLAYAREHRVLFWEARIARDAAVLEAAYGEPDEALTLFDATIDSLHRAGEHATLAVALADLAVFFDRIGRADIAATIHGTSTRHQSTSFALELPAVLERLRATLGETEFNHCVTSGASMPPAEAVPYDRHQIQLVRREGVTSRSHAPALTR